MRRFLFLVIPTLLAFWSCSDSSLFLGRNDQPAQVSVESVASGTMLASGDEVRLAISRSAVFTGNESSADQLRVDLLDSAGTVLAEQVYDSVDQATDLPPLTLPDLADGLYQLYTAYYDGDQLVSERTVPFFIVSDSYRIVGLTSYPASSYPGADGLLQVSLDVPADSDPYLVWWINDTAVAEGPLSQTGSTVAVRAPATSGVYPVRVDLFPFLPDTMSPSSVEAPASYSTELVVADAPTPARTDLVPQESYFALYHFRGSLEDDGVRSGWYPSRDFTAVPFGAPIVAAESDVFGYLLDGTSGFTMNASVWPAYDGALSPISISFRVLPTVLEDDVVIASVIQGGELLRIESDATGRVGARIADGSTLWSAIPLLSVDHAETVTITIVPGEPTTVSFFSGGQLVSTGEDAVVLPTLARTRLIPGSGRWSLLDGTTTVGDNANGFTGVIDEFGVFFRDEADAPAVNTSLFRDSMHAEYGDRLVYAASFDSPADAAELRIDGQAEVSDGSLVLGPNADVTFPEFRFQDEDLVVTVELVLTTDLDFRVRAIDSDRELARRTLAARPDDPVVEITLIHRGDTLTLVNGDGEDELASGLSGFEGVIVSLASPHAGSDASQLHVMIRSVVARRDHPQMPAGLFAVDAGQGDVEGGGRAQ